MGNANLRDNTKKNKGEKEEEVVGGGKDEGNSCFLLLPL